MHRAGSSVEQSELKMFLDLPDQEADGRLGHAHLRGSFSQAAKAVNQNERLELPYCRIHEVIL
jgi:hypothetical protein